MPTKMNAFSIAMALIGTLIGAGYASGQELMQFFGAYGTNGIIGIGIALVFFFIYAYTSMVVGHRMNSDNYAEVMSPAKNKFIMVFVDFALFSFLFGVFVVMIAGSSAIFIEQLPMDFIPEALQSMFGGLVLVVLTALTAWWGLSSIQKGFNTAVPLLVLGSGIISLLVYLHPQAAMDENTITPLTSPLVGNWASSAIIYVFYNMLVAVCVLIPLGFYAKTKQSTFWGALLGCLGFCGLALLLILGIVSNYSLVSETSIPMLVLAKSINPSLGYTYAVIMFLAIYSTAIGLIFGKLSRLRIAKWYNIKYDRVSIIVISTAGLILSKVGFVQLVGIVYPFYGYISGILLFGLMFNLFYYSPARIARGDVVINK